MEEIKKTTSGSDEQKEEPKGEIDLEEEEKQNKEKKTIDEIFDEERTEKVKEMKSVEELMEFMEYRKMSLESETQPNERTKEYHNRLKWLIDELEKIKVDPKAKQIDLSKYKRMIVLNENAKAFFAAVFDKIEELQEKGGEVDKEIIQMSKKHIEETGYIFDIEIKPVEKLEKMNVVELESDYKKVEEQTNRLDEGNKGNKSLGAVELRKLYREKLENYKGVIEKVIKKLEQDARLEKADKRGGESWKENMLVEERTLIESNLKDVFGNIDELKDKNKEKLIELILDKIDKIDKLNDGLHIRRRGLYDHNTIYDSVRFELVFIKRAIERKQNAEFFDQAAENIEDSKKNYKTFSKELSLFFAELAKRARVVIESKLENSETEKEAVLGELEGKIKALEEFELHNLRRKMDDDLPEQTIEERYSDGVFKSLIKGDIDFEKVKTLTIKDVRDIIENVYKEKSAENLKKLQEHYIKVGGNIEAVLDDPKTSEEKRKKLLESLNERTKTLDSSALSSFGIEANPENEKKALEIQTAVYSAIIKKYGAEKEKAGEKKDEMNFKTGDIVWIKKHFNLADVEAEVKGVRNKLVYVYHEGTKTGFDVDTEELISWQKERKSNIGEKKEDAVADKAEIENKLGEWMRETMALRIKEGGEENYILTVYNPDAKFVWVGTKKGEKLEQLTPEEVYKLNVGKTGGKERVDGGKGAEVKESFETKVTKIKKELFENAGNKSKEDLDRLISNVEKILDGEKEKGKGKLKDKISEIRDSEFGKEKFMDGSVVYLPKDGEAIFIGDTHGDPDAAVSVIEQEKFIEAMEREEKNKYLVFLGDYVDRGKGDVENIEQIIALYEKYPNNVVLLRGNHEGKESAGYNTNFMRSVLKKYGDQDTVKSLRKYYKDKDGTQKYYYPVPVDGENLDKWDWERKFKADDPGKKLYEKYNELFEKLPGIVVCANGIVGVHGGIPNEDIKSLKELNDPKKLYEMRWNDPAEGMYTVERAKSGRGEGITAFDKAPFERFVNAVDGKVVVRAHENEPGKTQFDNRLLTVFSTGKGGTKSEYGGIPVYAKFDLSKDVDKIKVDNIKKVEYIKPDYKLEAEKPKKEENKEMAAWVNLRNGYRNKSKDIENRYKEAPVEIKKKIEDYLKSDILDSFVLEKYDLDTNEENKKKALEIQKEAYRELLSDLKQEKNVQSEPKKDQTQNRIPNPDVERKEAPRTLGELFDALGEDGEKLREILTRFEGNLKTDNERFAEIATSDDVKRIEKKIEDSEPLTQEEIGIMVKMERTKQTVIGDRINASAAESTAFYLASGDKDIKGMLELRVRASESILKQYEQYFASRRKEEDLKEKEGMGTYKVKAAKRLSQAVENGLKKKGTLKKLGNLFGIGLTPEEKKINEKINLKNKEVADLKKKKSKKEELLEILKNGLENKKKEKDEAEELSDTHKARRLDSEIQERRTTIQSIETDLQNDDIKIKQFEEELEGLFDSYKIVSGADQSKAVSPEAGSQAVGERKIVPPEGKKKNLWSRIFEGGKKETSEQKEAYNKLKLKKKLEDLKKKEEKIEKELKKKENEMKKKKEELEKAKESNNEKKAKKIIEEMQKIKTFDLLSDLGTIKIAISRAEEEFKNLQVSYGNLLEAEKRGVDDKENVAGSETMEEANRLIESSRNANHLGTAFDYLWYNGIIEDTEKNRREFKEMVIDKLNKQSKESLSDVVDYCRKWIDGIGGAELGKETEAVLIQFCEKIIEVAEGKKQNYEHEGKKEKESLEKYNLSDAYEIVKNNKNIGKEWKAHPNLKIDTSNEPVVIDEEVIKDYNDLVVQKAKSTNNEIPFFFVMDKERNRIVKIFVGDGDSYGRVIWNQITSKAKDGLVYNDWIAEQTKNKNLYDGKKGKYMVGLGHTHPKGYGPIFSHVEGKSSKFGLDYEATLRLWEGKSKLYSHETNLHLLGAPDMGLVSAIEAKEDGAISFHPIDVAETSSGNKIKVSQGKFASGEDGEQGRKVENTENNLGAIRGKLEGIFENLKKNNPDLFKSLKDYLLKEKKTDKSFSLGDIITNQKSFLNNFKTGDSKLDLNFEEIKNLDYHKFFAMAKEVYEKVEGKKESEAEKKENKMEKARLNLISEFNKLSKPDREGEYKGSDILEFIKKIEGYKTDKNPIVDAILKEIIKPENKKVRDEMWDAVLYYDARRTDSSNSDILLKYARILLEGKI